MKHHNFRQRLQMVELLNVMMWKKATWSLHCFSHRKTSAIKHAWSSTSCSKSKTHIWQVPTVLRDLSAEGRMGKKYLITGDCQLWETDLRVKNITHTIKLKLLFIIYPSVRADQAVTLPTDKETQRTTPQPYLKSAPSSVSTPLYRCCWLKWRANIFLRCTILPNSLNRMSQICKRSHLYFFY